MDPEVSLREYVDTVDRSLQRQIEALQRERELAMRQLQRQIELLGHEREVAVAALEKTIDRRFESVEQAGIRSQEALNLRLESMNELRGSLRDQSSTFVTRAEWRTGVDAANSGRERIIDSLGGFATRIELASVVEKQEGLQNAVSEGEGRRSVVSVVVALSASLVVSVVTALIIFVVNRH